MYSLGGNPFCNESNGVLSIRGKGWSVVSIVVVKRARLIVFTSCPEGQVLTVVVQDGSKIYLPAFRVLNLVCNNGQNLAANSPQSKDSSLESWATSGAG